MPDGPVLGEGACQQWLGGEGGMQMKWGGIGGGSWNLKGGASWQMFLVPSTLAGTTCSDDNMSVCKGLIHREVPYGLTMAHHNPHITSWLLNVQTPRLQVFALHSKCGGFCMLDTHNDSCSRARSL